MAKKTPDKKPQGRTSLMLAVVFILIVAAAAYFILKPG